MNSGLDLFIDVCVCGVIGHVFVCCVVVMRVVNETKIMAMVLRESYFHFEMQQNYVPMIKRRSEFQIQNSNCDKNNTKCQFFKYEVTM